MKQYNTGTNFRYLDELPSIALSEDQKNQLTQFSTFVLKWNQQLNLTAITDPKEFWIKHIYDSLTCLPLICAGNDLSVIDIGTGAGFPGIPIKIAYPEIRLTLVESIKKKADFCRRAVEELGLLGVQVLAQRAETIGQADQHRARYDWAVARAVAPLTVLVEYLLPLVPIGGCALAQKGGNAGEEISRARHAIQTLGGAIDQVHDLELPEDAGSRTLITIKKMRATPAKYPRRAGTPKKNPLV